MLRFAISGLRYVETAQLICRYRMHPDSMTFGGNESMWETILREHTEMTGSYLRRPDLSKHWPIRFARRALAALARKIGLR